MSVLGAVDAGAQPSTATVVRLEYAAPDTCPNEEILHDLVVSRLGRLPFHSDASDVVQVQIVARDAAFHASVSSPQRELTSNDCEDLVSAVAMVLTLSLDEARGEAVAEPEPREAQTHWSAQLSEGARAALEALDDEQPVGVSSAPVEDPEPEERAWQAGLDLSLGASLGFVPGLAMGGSAGVAIQGETFSLRLGLAGEATLRPAGREEVRGVLATASVAGCGQIAPFFGCLVVRAGALMVRAERVVQPQWAVAFFAASGIKVGVGYRRRDIYLFADLGFEVALSRPEFSVGDSLAFEPAPVGGRLSFGISWFAS